MARRIRSLIPASMVLLLWQTTLRGVDDPTLRDGITPDIWHVDAVCYGQALECNQDECRTWEMDDGEECWQCTSSAYHRTCVPTIAAGYVCRERPLVEEGCGSMRIGLCVSDGEGGTTCVTVEDSPGSNFLCFRFDCTTYREVSPPTELSPP